MKEIRQPFRKEDFRGLKTGEKVLLSGVIYTARDQAHKRINEAIIKNRRLPLDLAGQVIYYCGPTRTPPGKAIGSCGPTTSSRMDELTPFLLKAGLLAMIGKGGRSPQVRAAIKKYKAVYFLAPAGCGALVTKYVRKAKPYAYKDLGPEAIYRLQVEGLPLIVGIDARGRDIFKKIQLKARSK